MSLFYKGRPKLQLIYKEKDHLREMNFKRCCRVELMYTILLVCYHHKKSQLTSILGLVKNPVNYRYQIN